MKHTLSTHLPSLSVRYRALTASYVFACLTFQCGLLLLVPTAHSQPSHCLTLFRKRAYYQASLCFRDKAQKMGVVHRLSLTQKYTKGRYLKNASLALSKAAQANTQQAHKSYIYEQALYALQDIIRHQMYENTERKQEVLQKIAQLRTTIAYARLHIQLPHSTTRICIRGYKYKNCSNTPVIRVHIRPGKYTVLGYTQTKTTYTKKLHLAPNASQRLHSLRPVRGSLRVTSTPAGAQIYLDGKYIGTTPHTLASDFGTHTIRLQKKCYTQYAQTIQLNQNKKQHLLFAQLHKKPPTRAPSNPNQAMGWWLVGGGAALVGFGVIAQSLSIQHREHGQNAYRRYIQTRPDNLPQGTQIQNELQRLYTAFNQENDIANGWQTASTVSLGLGIGSFGFGLYFLLSRPSSPPSKCFTKVK